MRFVVAVLLIVCCLPNTYAAGILGLWKGPSLIYKNGKVSQCELSVYLKQKTQKLETLTNVICKHTKHPLKVMSQSLNLNKDKIIDTYITGQYSQNRLSAQALYNPHHKVSVNMLIKNERVMTYDFSEFINNDLSLIRATLIRQDQ